MATRVNAGDLVSSSWQFFSKHINKLWQVAVLISLPSIISALLVDPKPVLSEEELSGITDLSGFTQAAFGVSVATAGFFLLVWLVASIVYSAIVYGGSIHSLLGAIRGHAGELSFSGVFNAGMKRFGSLILLGIAISVFVGVGLFLLVIPGLIAAFLLSFSPFFLVDKNQGVGDSMSASYNLVKNNVGSVFMVFLVVFLINLGVGLVVGAILSSSADLIQALSALASGFLAVFTLVAAGKLYLALTHHSSASAE